MRDAPPTRFWIRPFRVSIAPTHQSKELDDPTPIDLRLIAFEPYSTTAVSQRFWREKWCHLCQNESAGMAKFRAWLSRSLPTSTRVVMPIRLPRESKRPPPEEPGEMGAVVWM